MSGPLVEPTTSSWSAPAETRAPGDEEREGRRASAAPSSAPAPALDPRASAPEPSPEPSWSGRPLRRSGFHFHADLGLGSGDSSAGLYHSMEIGGSLRGYTLSLLHSFIQYRNVFGQADPTPHEIGGFFLQLRGPLLWSDLSWKFAAGVGGTVDQSNGFQAHPGFGVHYGVDAHLPLGSDFAATLSLSALTVEDRGSIYFGAAAALGVSVF